MLRKWRTNIHDCHHNPLAFPGSCHMHDQQYQLPSPSDHLRRHITIISALLRPHNYPTVHVSASPPIMHSLRFSLTLLFISTHSSIVRRSFTLYRPFEPSFVSAPLIT